MRLYPGVSIVTLGVSDLGRAQRFYEQLRWRRSRAASTDRISFFALNSLVLALFDRMALAEDAGVADGEAAVVFSGVTLAQNYGSKAAVRMAMDEALAAGARGLKAPQDTAWGGYHATFADPDGHVWELAYNPFVELAADGTILLPD